MNWDAIGAIGEVVGAVAVVASLVYLARQIRQNSSLVEQSAAATRSQAAVTSAGHGAEAFRSLAGQPDLARIWTVGTLSPGSLGEDELRRYDLLVLAQLIEIDVNYLLARSGVLDPEIWAIWEGVLDIWARNPRFRERWQAGSLSPFLTASLCARIREKLAAQSDRHSRVELNE